MLTNLRYRSFIPSFFWVFLFGFFALGGRAQNSVQNGSFEVGFLPQPDWTGDYILYVGYTGAADGRNFIGIGNSSQYAAQTLATSPGQTYKLSFAQAGNSAFPGSSILDVSWNGEFLGDTTWVSPDKTSSPINFHWIYDSFDVTATSYSTVLSFQEDSATTLSPFLDAVQVVPTPEPSCIVLLNVGGLVIILQLRYRAGSPNNSPEPTPFGHRSSAITDNATNTARLSFFR